MKNLITILSVILAVSILTGCKDTTAQEQQTGQGSMQAAEPANSQNEENTAPGFTLTDQDGKTHSLSDYEGKLIVLEWTNTDCPFVKRHYDAKTMTTLADKYVPKDVVWLTINSSHYADQKMNKEFTEKYGITYPVLDDSGGKVGKLYGAKTTPHMFIINKDGMIVYEGAIDNDPAGDKEEITNYVEIALDELLAGKGVTTAETQPYGCSVKYAK
jgi:peroxiredoxin